MASDHNADLIKKLERGLNKSSQFFESLEQNRWSERVSAGLEAWTVKQLVWHFIFSEQALLKIAQDISSGGPGVSEGYDIDAFNQEEMNEFPQLSIDQLMALLVDTRKTTLDWVHTLDESILEMTGGHPTMGHSNVETLIFSIYAHQLLHMREVVPYLKKDM
jgi:hypothetical protein